MTEPRPQPIRRQLALLLLALGLPFVLYLSVSGFVHARKEREHAGQEMLALARVAAARLDDHVGDISEVLAVLSEVVGVTPADEAANDALLSRIASRLPPQTNNVLVAAADGHVVGSLDPRMRGQLADLGPQAAHAQALARPGLALRAPFKSPLNGEAVAVFALRIERAGKVVGVVSMSTQLRVLQSLLDPSGSLPDGAVATVVGADGIVLARSIDPDAWIGRNLRPMPSGFAESWRLHEGVRDGPSADGTVRIAGFATSRHVPWMVYIGLPVHQAIAAARMQLIENLAAGMVLLLVGVLLSTRISRRISASLQRLQADARALQDGDLSRRADVRGSGEITVLAATMNRMADALQQRTRSLEASQQQLSDLYENAPCGYHSVDASGLYLRVNETELAWLGLAREEVVGKRHVTDFLTADGQARFARHLRRMQTEDRLDGLELELVGSTGTRRHVIASASVLRDANGAFEATRTVLYDISERKLAEQAGRRSLALEMENRRLQEAMRFKELLLASLSHELRTPLNAVVGYTHLLQSGLILPGTVEFSAHLDRVGRGARELQGMIDSLLDFAKATADEIETHPREVDVARLLEAVQQSLAEAMRERRVDVATEIDPALGPVVVDELRLSQVVAAFVSNAVKFSRPGGLVQVRARLEGDSEFRIEVEDHGIGISADDLPHLFTPFRRLGESSTRSHPGAGLGLALASKLASALGGRVGVTSRLAFGSTLDVVLPRRPPAA